MKILWLYKFLPLYDFDNWLHARYAEYLSTFPNTKCFAYGRDMHIGYPKITVVPYNPYITMQNLYDMFEFDVVLVCTKSRCFNYYDPKQGRAEGCWLPQDFRHWDKTPKIVLEEDYHYEMDDLWYLENGIRLILQRHYSQSLRQQNVPMRWFPFSVDTNYFNTNTGLWHKDKQGFDAFLPFAEAREGRIAFVGNNADPCYVYRKNAINTLLNAGIGANYSGAKKVGLDYIDVLHKYVGYISCGSTYHICAAKNFEIMASGGVLFTNPFLGIEKLFPEGSYIGYFDHCQGLADEARRVINDVEYRTKIVQKSLDCIHSLHSHEVRTAELFKIIEELK